MSAHLPQCRNQASLVVVVCFDALAAVFVFPSLHFLFALPVHCADNRELGRFVLAP